MLACGYASGVESAELALVEMGEMGKGSFQVRLDPLVAGALQRATYSICPLEIGTTMTNFSQENQNMKSRLNRAVHVHFLGEAGVKFPRLTRLTVMAEN